MICFCILIPVAFGADHISDKNNSLDWNQKHLYIEKQDNSQENNAFVLPFFYIQKSVGKTNVMQMLQFKK